jgi:hypothetical protein
MLARHMRLCILRSSRLTIEMKKNPVSSPKKQVRTKAKPRTAKKPVRKSLTRRRDKEATSVIRETPPEYGTPVCHVEPMAFSTLDLFCGAGGITEGFRRAGFSCLYANDINHWAVETFRANHPNTAADNRPIEQVDAAALRRSLNLRAGQLDVLVGGPPCQGFSINAPERFLEDPRNSLFKHYIRFLDEFQPRTLLIENVPGMLSLKAA